MTRTLERTRVGIVGGGPAGLLLSLLLHRAGIDNVVVERRTRAHVLERVRAGVLERGSVALLHEAGVGARLEREGQRHGGTVIAWNDERVRIDFADLTGHEVVVYGQTEVTRDLYAARDAAALPTAFEAEDVVIEGADTSRARLRWREPDGERTLECDHVVGCDGFHGVSRRTIPAAVRTEHEKLYPFGWLGVLAETPPVHEELVYASSDEGFALCSMRGPELSRYYVQCALDEGAETTSDEAFWDALRRRLPADLADALVTGPTFGKSVAPLRSFVTEPMRWGRLFLCGDAAHIVPPTGAKGLNLALGDVHYLFRAMDRYYNHGDDRGLEEYSARALERVWKAERFSWWMTSLLHRFPGSPSFDARMQAAEFTHLRDTPAAREVLAINYVGLPF